MQIQITGGILIFDEEDQELIQKHSWYTKGGKYAITRIGKKLVRLHRLLMNPPAHMHIDHANGNGLDNRRANLRIVTRSQNMWNSVKKNRGGERTTSSQFKGVNVNKNVPCKRWIAEVWKDGRKIFGRSFYTERDAAIAYNIVASRAFGEYVLLNNVYPTLEDLQRISKMVDAPPIKTKGTGGVCFDKRWQKWVAKGPQKDGKRPYLGGFSSKSEAFNAVSRSIVAAT